MTDSIDQLDQWTSSHLMTLEAYIEYRVKLFKTQQVSPVPHIVEIEQLPDKGRIVKILPDNDPHVAFVYFANGMLPLLTKIANVRIYWFQSRNIGYEWQPDMEIYFNGH